MPIYEYECRDCGEKFEMFRSINSSDSEIKCPKCGVENAQRVFSLFARGSSSSGGGCVTSGST